ncbi:eukaryotic aspartyl protease domain-containing protein [Ditylenchus destructor]|nr:eukaryotic aspartyl protease domain-containing protein [Ditylenchus destructor]
MLHFLSHNLSLLKIILLITFLAVKSSAYLNPSKVRLEDVSNYIWRGNVGFGTPNQSFKIQFAFNQDIFFVLGKNISIYGSGYVQKFDPSLSTTYTKEGKEFLWMYTRQYEGAKGPIATDNISLGDSKESAQLEFGVNEIEVFNYFDQADGILGLSPKCFDVCNMTLPVQQILSQYKSQMFTFWSNRPPQQGVSNGSAILTLGEIDKENCADKWVYVPRNQTPNSYAFYVHSVAISGMTFDMKKRKARITDSHGAPSMIVMSSDFIYYVLGQVGGYVKQAGFQALFYAPCNASFPNITLKIGENGIDSVILTKKDYVWEYPTDDHKSQCFLIFSEAKLDDTTSISDYYFNLGNNFMNNHCFSYDLQNDIIGFADALPPKKEKKKVSVMEEQRQLQRQEEIPITQRVQTAHRDPQIHTSY